METVGTNLLSLTISVVSCGILIYASMFWLQRWKNIIEVEEWTSYYIPPFYMNAIIYPCPKLMMI